MIFNWKDPEVRKNFKESLILGACFGVLSFILCPLTMTIIIFGPAFMETAEMLLLGGDMGFPSNTYSPSPFYTCLGQFVFCMLVSFISFVIWHNKYLEKLERDKEWRLKKQAAMESKQLAANPASSKLRHYIVYADTDNDTLQAVFEAAADSEQDVRTLAIENGINIRGMKISKTNLFLSDTHGFRVTQRFIRETNVIYKTSQLRQADSNNNPKNSEGQTTK